MKTQSTAIAAMGVAGLLLAGLAAAAPLSAGDQYNVDQIRSGSPAGLRAAAQNIQASGVASQEVSDVLADELLKVQAQQGDIYIDAVAWSCKALAATGSKRYYTVLKEVSGNGAVHKKARKHCENSAAALGGPDGEQYALGMAKATATPAGAAPATVAVAPPPGGFKPITEIKPEMSYGQVMSISGPATSENSRITGKAFIPFNFKGADSQRTIAHYKGQGRIVFANTSAYTNGKRVLEVQIDPNEPGY